MSTRSYIGIKNGDKVKYIYCHSDGYLSYNGVFLNAFYRNIEKVEKLIALGDISAIGYNVEAPKDYNGNFFEASNHHTYMGRHTNTSFVLSNKAFVRKCNKTVSTIETSSTITTSLSIFGTS